MFAYAWLCMRKYSCLHYLYTKYDIINQYLNISLFYLSDSNAFLLGNVFRENKNKLTVSHFIKVMEMQNIQLLELLTLS